MNMQFKTNIQGVHLNNFDMIHITQTHCCTL